MPTNAITLLLLPGLDGTGRLFDGLRAALPADLRARVVSYPGDRAFDYPTLVAFVRERWPDGAGVIVVAESFSGPVGVALAADPPPGMAGLVLAASFVRAPLRWMPSALVGRVGRAVFRLRPPRRALDLLLTGGRPELSRQVLAALREVRSDVLAERLRQVTRVDATDQLAQVALPVLVLSAKRDRLLGDGAAELVMATARHASRVELDSPHLLLQAVPGQAAAAILEFAASLPPSRP